ncbi:MAG TPA: neutral/alkaline non-lysosomal ceramidase N-terminal domain-containing protein [Opitutaceae bacterium]|nr:neutral/alkaline non-lysosomal ceramidase N-terminal domain-containing protein [Opitutaceae bacterium]
MNLRKAIGCLVLLTAALCAPLRAAAIRAGVARVDITPPAGLPMYGYFDRIEKHQLSTGTLDPLYARVVVLEAGGRRMALVTLDLGRTFNESWLGRMRAAALEASHIDVLVVSASHTHSGPNILDEYPTGGPPAWEGAVFDKVLQATRRAAQDLQPARLGTAYGNAYVGYNRRRVNPDGSVTMLWLNPEKVANGPVDTTVGVLRIDRQDGSPIAVLVNYACHPVVFGSDNLQYSADFIGPMAGTVEGAFGGKPLCLFFQGAAGDIKPYYGSTPLNKGAAERNDWTGRELGTEAARLAKGIETEASAASSLDFSDDVMAFDWRWDPRKLRDGLLRAKGPLIFQDHVGVLGEGSMPARLSLRVTTVLVNRQIAFVTMPGEPFVEFQVGWRNRCPVRSCFFLGYTNGYYDYFPTILAASQGGYGAGDSDTYVEVGAGERMLDRALVRVHEMLGELGQVPIATPWVAPPAR